MPARVVLYFILCLAIFPISCAQSDEETPPPFLDRGHYNPFQYDDPEEFFTLLEERLLNEEYLFTGASVLADSAMEATLAAKLWTAPNGQARLTAEGVMTGFVDENATIRFVSDGTNMAGGRSATVGFESGTPRELNKALILGLTRMGIMHNLFQLFTGSPPEFADGGLEDVLEVHSFEWLEPIVVRRWLTRPMRFTVRVNGEDSGEATLFIVRDTGLPNKRVQTVDFAQGQMVVTELYPRWIFTEPVLADAFVLDASAFE